MRQLIITKCDKCLLQNASGFLLQNAIVLLQMRELLQIATILLQNATVITKCNVYHAVAGRPDLYTKKKDIDTKKQFPWTFSKIQDSIFKKPQRKRNKERRI